MSTFILLLNRVRPRRDLAFENLALRQQPLILSRSCRRIKTLSSMPLERWRCNGPRAFRLRLTAGSRTTRRFHGGHPTIGCAAGVAPVAVHSIGSPVRGIVRSSLTLHVMPRLRWPNPIAVAAAGVALGGAITTLGIVMLIMDCSASAPSPSEGAWARSAASAATPVFLARPVVSSGEGWSIETRVANLAQLDLVIAAEDTGRLSLVDVYTGEAVAVGTFGYNTNARLRADPRQLFIADRTTSSDRLLVFNVTDTGFTLASQTALPGRVGCTGGFCNFMYLPDDHDLFIPHRTILDTPECQPNGGDAARCLVYSFGQVDLSAPISTRQIPVPLNPPCSKAPPNCHGLEVCAGIDVEPSPDGGWLFRCNGTFMVLDPNGELATAFSLTQPADQAVFGTALSDGTFRAVTQDGSVHTISASGADSGSVQLLNSGQHIDTVWRVDDTYALATAGYSYTLGSLILVDLDHSRVAAAMKQDQSMSGLTVLDSARAVLLLRTDTSAELQQVDLTTGKLGQIIPLRNLPGLPSAIVR